MKLALLLSVAALLGGRISALAQMQSDARGKITAAPNQGTTIRTYCASRLQQPQPLYVLDGFVLNLSGPILSDIHPDDIAAINVVKGEQAVQRYGAAGSNGVIEITTNNALLVQGRLLRTTAEKAALAASSARSVRTVRLLTAAELAQYGLPVGTHARALTLAGKPRTTPVKVQLPQGN